MYDSRWKYLKIKPHDQILIAKETVELAHNFYLHMIYLITFFVLIMENMLDKILECIKVTYVYSLFYYLW